MLVFNLRKVENPDLVAELADFLLRQQGVNYVLGMGWFDGTQILSMRSLNPEVKLGLIIQTMVAGIGTAGGHGMIAGGQVRNIDGGDLAQQELEQELTRRMFQALDLPQTAGESLI